MKTCNEAGCNNLQFGGFKCKYHQFCRYRKGGDLYKPKQWQKPIAKESPRRKIENKKYLERLKEKWEEDVKNGTNKCFFCDELMNVREDNHHLLGRGNVILEEKWWVWAHRKCHFAYEFDPVDKLRRYPWWEGFLTRLRKKSPSTYYKDLNRINKTELEFDN